MIVLQAIVAALSTRVGQAAVIGLGAVAVFVSWLTLHDVKVANKATTNVVTSLNTQAEKLTHEALKAREPASRPGAAERLRRNACTDCDGEAALSGRKARLH